MSRQTLSKYETEVPLPDVEKNRLIAEVFAEGEGMRFGDE